jgi:hypothetical protein
MILASESLHSLPSTENNIPVNGMRLYVSPSLQQLRLLLIVQHAGISTGMTIYTNTELGGSGTVSLMKAGHHWGMETQPGGRTTQGEKRETLREKKILERMKGG